MLPWPKKRCGGRQRPTFLLSFRAGTTPEGLQRQDHGHGRRARLKLHQLQVRFPIGFSPIASRALRAQRHHLLRQMWSGLLGTGGRAVPQLQRTLRWSDIAAAQIEVRAVSKQALSWLHCGRRSSALPGRGNHFGRAGGVGVGSHSVGANHTQKKATCCPAGSSAGTPGTHLWVCQDEGLGFPALGPGSTGLVGGVCAQRSAGDKAFKAEGSNARKTD